MRSTATIRCRACGSPGPSSRAVLQRTLSPAPNSRVASMKSGWTLSMLKVVDVIGFEHWSVRRRRLVGNSDEDRAHHCLQAGVGAPSLRPVAPSTVLNLLIAPLRSKGAVRSTRARDITSLAAMSELAGHSERDGVLRTLRR